jgi:hypothetical protein
MSKNHGSYISLAGSDSFEQLMQYATYNSKLLPAL